MMRRSLPALPAFILTGVLLLWVGALHADPSFHFTAINFPGAALTNAQGTSPGGDIVGTYTDALGKQHGFLFSNGNFTSIDFPAAVGTVARSINPGELNLGVSALAQEKSMDECRRPLCS